MGVGWKGSSILLFLSSVQTEVGERVKEMRKDGSGGEVEVGCNGARRRPHYEH